MIQITYHIVLAEPTDTVHQRLSRVMEQCKYICVPLYLVEDKGMIYKFMQLSVDGNSVRLHSVSNPLTQYKNIGILEITGS